MRRAACEELWKARGWLKLRAAPDLSGKRVLVVEDSYFIAIEIADALSGAGAEVLGPCPSESAAFDMIERYVPTHGIVDLNLGGTGPRFEVAMRLKIRDVPIIIVTGYDVSLVTKQMPHTQIVQKPFSYQEILTSLAQL